MEIDKFDRGNEEFVRIGRRKYRYMAGYNTTTRSFDGVMYIVVVIVGALFIIDGKITAADYMAYLLYISTLLTSIRGWWTTRTVPAGHDRHRALL